MLVNISDEQLIFQAALLSTVGPLAVMMSQSQVTEYFHGRKRNNNFQPSKRQKVQVESYHSDAPNTGTLQVARDSGTKKTNAGVVQTKSAVTANSKKHSTRSRIPKLQNDSKSRNARLSDIWPKACEVTINSDLVNDADGVTTGLPRNYSVCPSTPSKQHPNVLEHRKSGQSEDDSVTKVDSANTVSGNKLPKSPSKRAVQCNKSEGSERSTVSDIATAVIDDHGNSHPCTPSKQRTVEHGVVSDVVNNKRGRCVVPTNNSNYYKTPQKFDFSPFQSSTSAQRSSSSARKKLVLSKVNLTKSPPVFVFEGSTEKSTESPVATEVKEKDLAEVQNKTKDATVELSLKLPDEESGTDVAEEAETATPKTRKRETKTPSKNASEIVKIGPCRNLEQLKKKLQDLSPRKAKIADGGNDGLSTAKRYT